MKILIQARFEYEDGDAHFAWDSFSLLLGLFETKAKAMAAAGHANKILQWRLKELDDHHEDIRILRAKFEFERSKPFVLYAAFDIKKLRKHTGDLIDAIIVEPTEDSDLVNSKIASYRSTIRTGSADTEQEPSGKGPGF